MCRNSQVTVRKFPLQSVLYLEERGEEIEQAKLTKYRIIIFKLINVKMECFLCTDM